MCRQIHVVGYVCGLCVGYVYVGYVYITPAIFAVMGAFYLILNLS